MSVGLVRAGTSPWKRWPLELKDHPKPEALNGKPGWHRREGLNSRSRLLHI